MAKSTNSVGSITHSTHIVLQGKGGVGKSVCSWVLAQYLKDQGVNVRCIDTDASNQTLTQFKALNVQPLKLSDDGLSIEPRRFDDMMERLLSEEHSFVIDTGSNTFLPLWKYMVENNALGMLEAAGRKVYLHCVITGGQGLLDTLNGLDFVTQAANDNSVVVWINEYFGKVEQVSTEGVKTFTDMAAYTERQNTIIGAVTFKKRSADTFGRDLDEVTKAKLTFQEALDSNHFTLMSKQRLRTMQRDLNDQLDQLGLK